MPGRAPKPVEQRRNRHEPRAGEWVDLEPLERPVLPPLPSRTDGESWPEMTVMMWEAWRRDPVTSQWGPADAHFALETARLHAMDPGGKEAAEIRLRCDRLGLTPAGKRNLRWRTPAEVETIARQSAKVTRLRVVSDAVAGA